jgi:hypothetical protein
LAKAPKFNKWFLSFLVCSFSKKLNILLQQLCGGKSTVGILLKLNNLRCKTNLKHQNINKLRQTAQFFSFYLTLPMIRQVHDFVCLGNLFFTATASSGLLPAPAQVLAPTREEL